jgi:hypothetical protein
MTDNPDDDPVVCLWVSAYLRHIHHWPQKRAFRYADKKAGKFRLRHATAAN